MAGAGTRRAQRWAVAGLLVAVVLAGTALRLEEALQSPVLPGEDPYTHMARARHLIDTGTPRPDYPPGFPVLVAAAELAAPGALYPLARWGPAALGALGIVAVYALARRLGGSAAGVTAAAVVAVSPDVIYRSELLIPTALDLSLVPVALLGLTAGLQGRRWGWPVAAVAAVTLLLTHPWAMGVVAAIAGPFLLWWGLREAARRERLAAAVGVLAGAVVLAVALAAAAWLWLEARGVWNPACCGGRAMDVLTGRAPRGGVGIHIANPTAPHALAGLVGPPATVLGLAGAALALRRRDALAALGAAWTAGVLPLVVVDWFGVWWLPYRTVVYLVPGVALLAAVVAAEVAEAAARVDARPARGAVVAGGVAAAVLLAATTPAVAAMPEWHRYHTEGDYQAFDAAAQATRENHSELVVGAWQARSALYAIHGVDASLDHGFFTNFQRRSWVVNQSQGPVHVLVDDHLAERALRGEVSLAFLHGPMWSPVMGQDGNTLYRYVGPPGAYASDYTHP